MKKILLLLTVFSLLPATIVFAEDTNEKVFKQYYVNYPDSTDCLEYCGTLAEECQNPLARCFKDLGYYDSQQCERDCQYYNNLRDSKFGAEINAIHNIKY